LCLKISETDQDLVVANTHLFYKDEKIRDRQMKDLMAFLKSEESLNGPLLVCGDFNATPSSSLMSVVDKYELKSAYSHKDAQCKFFFTSYTKTKNMLDYIFYLPSIMELIGFETLPNEDLLLPSEKLSSDHIAIKACFNIK
jgi:endonuclease/exonuclease/phosphatase family metal-dependent hydrolase